MSGIKVTRENPATPLPTALEAPGDVSGEDVDWPTGPSTPLPLDGLSDVDAPTPADGDVLTWDDTAGEWIAAPGGGSDDDCTPFPHGSMGSTETLDPADGAVHTGTMTADLTVTLTAPTCDAFLLEFWATQDGTGGWDITWPGSVTVNGTPDTTLGTTTVWLLDTVDGGTSWVAFIAGGGGGGSPATTVESETTFGITPAVGTDTEYARQDHTHGSPDTDAVKDAGRWEHAVIPGSPPDDLYADGDWLYIWVP